MVKFLRIGKRTQFTNLGTLVADLRPIQSFQSSSVNFSENPVRKSCSESSVESLDCGLCTICEAYAAWSEHQRLQIVKRWFLSQN